MAQIPRTHNPQPKGAGGMAGNKHTRTNPALFGHNETKRRKSRHIHLPEKPTQRPHTLLSQKNATLANRSTLVSQNAQPTLEEATTSPQTHRVENNQ
jgi:hypothetical protein